MADRSRWRVEILVLRGRRTASRDGTESCCKCGSGVDDGLGSDLNLFRELGFERLDVGLGRGFAAGQRGEDAIGGCGYGVVGILFGALDGLGSLAVGDVERL